MKKEKINNEQKKNRNLLIVNTFFSWLTIILAIIFLLLFIFLKPFPERFEIQEMNKFMIEQGQDKNLIILLFFGFMTTFSIITWIASSIAVLIYYFAKNSYELKKIKEQETIGYTILKYFLEGLFIIFYLILSPFMIIYFWLLYEQEYNNKFQKINLLLDRNLVYLNKKSKTWFFALTLTTIPIISGVASLAYLYAPYKYTPTLSNVQENISKTLTVSKNNKNVFIFYFDRVQSYLWNALLYIDFIINKNNSFIQLFPEFNSYTKTISLSNLTRLSTPSMFGGYEFAGWIPKNSKTSIIYNQSQNKIVYLALERLARMCIKNNFKHITYNNAPYYGYKNFHHGEMQMLQNDFKKEHLDINTCTNYDLAYSKMGLNTKNIDNWKICEQYVLNNLPQFLNFKNTGSGVFNWSFFQSTHVAYNVKIKNNYTCQIKSDYYILSLWQAIQGLKNILYKFKYENKLVYDNTMFLIVSDHGYELKNYYRYYNDILDYLLTKQLINQEIKNKLLTFEYFGFNPIFMIKKFKKNQKIITTKTNINPNNFFINNHLVSTADIPYILEHEMNLIKGIQTTNSTSHFRSKFVDENNSISKFIKNQILLSPLDDSKSNTRKFILSLTKDWRFYADKKDWDIYKNLYYEIKNDVYFQNANFNVINKSD